MIDHLGITCSDLGAASAFYDRVLGVLGHTRMMDHGVALGYGTSHPSFWLAAAEEGSAGEASSDGGIHVAFTAPDATSVRAFHAAAVEAGAEVLHAPRHFPEYHAHYFATFVRDPDGNNVEAVCHTVAPDGPA